MKLTVINGSSACGNCIKFSCVVNDTNSALVLQNGILCEEFERSGPIIATNNCIELSILDFDIQQDTNQLLLTDFTIYGQKCFQGMINEVSIECMDATQTTDTLLLQVNSKLIL